MTVEVLTRIAPHAITRSLGAADMHDIKTIRDEPESFIAGLKRRGIVDAPAVTSRLLARDKELRDLLTRLQQAQARRNEASKLIGQAKASLALKQRSGSATKEDEAQANALMAEVAGLKDEIQAGEQKERELSEALRNELAGIPNLPAADVPDGTSEEENKPVPARAFGRAPGMNAPKDHVVLGEALGMLDFERAVKISGSRFVYVKGALARLNRALASFMLDIHTTKFGYLEVVPPLLVRDEAAFGTGQLPKFEDDLFQTFKAEEKQNRLWLIPTAEVSLTNYVNGEILAEAELPLRFTAYTPCFRAEAGAAGKDTRGMIRMHQFDKVELVSITTPEQSNAEHERMTDAAQEILKRLDLHHRVVTLCTGDMGFAARKTYDIEVWLPGQNRFREISSCSNCGEFQARRMNTRYRGSDGKIKGMVHTLNGSGLAIGRTLVAIMENYQQPDGSIAVPDALKPYMGGLERIEKKSHPRP
jgi:seryl-tRNA synthetase